MHSGDQAERDDGSHYIALADVYLNLVLILAFFVSGAVAVGHIGWEEVRYRDAETAFAAAVGQLPNSLRPMAYRWRNDPPGAQRWVFWHKRLFNLGTATLSPEGYDDIVAFAGLLRKHSGKWRRIRIEGHTMPPTEGQPENWGLSALRAAKVAQLFYTCGHIPPCFLAIAGRGGQNPLRPESPGDPRNERVEVVIEYAAAAAKSGGGLSPASQGATMGDLLLRAARLKRAGRYAEAEQQLLTAIGLSPSNVDAHRTLAWVYAASGRRELAISEFERVLQLAADPGTISDCREALQRLGHDGALQ